jgi:hypothetical protein
MALEGEDPELLATPRAYGRRGAATGAAPAQGRADPPADARSDAESVPLAARQAL